MHFFFIISFCHCHQCLTPKHAYFQNTLETNTSLPVSEHRHDLPEATQTVCGDGAGELPKSPDFTFTKQMPADKVGK